MGTQIGSGQMHRRVTAFQRRGIQNGLGALRMPFHLDDVRIGERAWCPPDEEDDLISSMDQALGQCPAQQAGSSAQ